MNKLLDNPPFAKRDHEQFLRELTELTRFQLDGCEEYRRMWPAWKCSEDVYQFPFVHVGVFKRIALRTASPTIKMRRVLRSSATTSGVSSQIVLDQKSSELQSRSSAAILADFLGWQQRPLVVLDSAMGLRTTEHLSARIAGAMSLLPLASDVMFLLKDSNGPNSMKWGEILRILDQSDELLVYGFTFMLWLAWAKAEIPEGLRDRLKTKRISFVHSGGWKKLEAIKVSREEFDEMLLATGGQGSKVIDFYGLVEQVGMVYPMCERGYRHVPLWADALVRDSITLDSIVNEPGQLQLVNTISWGAPYHNVLTEDVAKIVPGKCPCGRHGKRFELLGRIPKGEIRGCANV